MGTFGFSLSHNFNKRVMWDVGRGQVMKLRLHGTEQKATVQKTEHKTTGAGARLQQGSSSSAPQVAAGSLVTDGKNRGKQPDVHQQSSAPDGSNPARQQKKSFSLKSLFGGKKSSSSTAQTATPPAAETSRARGNSLRDLMAQETAQEQESAAPPQGASLTSSGGVRRQSLEDTAGRTQVKESRDGQQPPQHGLAESAPRRGSTLGDLLARPGGETEASVTEGGPRLTRSGGGRHQNLAGADGHQGGAEPPASGQGPRLTRSGGGRHENLAGLNGHQGGAEPPASGQEPRLTRSGGGRHENLAGLNGHQGGAEPPASGQEPRLTRSGGGRHENLAGLNGRPGVNGESTPVQQKQQLHNFSQMRQNMLNRMGQTSSSGTNRPAASLPASHHEIEEAPLSPVGTTATHSGTSEITEEDGDHEFEQLHQQRLARERENPIKPPRLGVATPPSVKFKPRLDTIAESALEGTSMKLSALQTQSTLKGGMGLGTAPLGITLENGKLQLDKANPKAINTLLAQTLGKDDQHYLAHSASSDNRQHLLLDHQGRLFDIKSSDSGYSVLHNSQSAEIKTKLAQAGKAPIALESNNGKVQLSIGTDGQNKLPLSPAGEMHRSLLSGIWQHPAGGVRPEGQSICLHDDKIHVLNPELGVWQTAGKEAHSQLSRQADGQLYALKDSRTLCNLSGNQASEKFVDKIKSYAVSEQGQVAILTDTDSPHHICVMPSLDTSPENRVQFSLHLADTMEQLHRGQPHLETQSIGMSKGRLYAADSEGKLYSGALSRVKDGELPMKALSQRGLNQHFGSDHRIAGFFNDDHGQLNALVKDNFRQEHACPLGEDHQFHPGWNLTDALVINNHLGLDHVNPEPHQVLNMGREGSLTLQEGKVHYFDQLTKGWTAAESDCKQLKKGLDGAAYILKDGEVKRLDINNSTSSISQGKDNFFALPHVRNKPDPGSALQGLSKTDKAQAMAVIGVNKYLALSEKGDIRSFQIKPGTQQLERPPQTLSAEGITGVLKDIHVDHQQNLYALNHDGEIFHQSREEWQSGEEGSGWQKLAMPKGEGKLQRLEMDHEHQPVATLEDGSQHQLRGGEWHAHTAPEPAPLEVGIRDSEQVFGRLTQGLRGRIIPGTGVTVETSAQVAGQTGRENRRISSKFADRVRAYIFNPTMTTPRPIKNAAYNIQHSWQGRQGLKPLYEMQGALIKQLESHNVRNSNAQPDLQSKLESLDLGEHGAGLLDDLKRFRDELEQSATRSATLLGQHQGVLKSNGEINSEFSPSPGKAVVQSFNVNRSGRDLSKALEKAVSLAAPSPQSKLQTLLSHFVSAGVNMSHQKGDVPMGRQRDPNDQTALTKSRLILDTVTLGDLHQLADKASLISGHQPAPDQIKQLRQQFDTLREKQYGGNPVKQYTDMGFTHTGALEADYDAVKAFINAFKKEHHGVNLTARTVLETSGNAEMAQKLKDTLLSLDSGESMSFSRSYSGGLNTVFVPTLKNMPVPVVPAAGVTLDRSYELSFSRTSGGLSVNFGRDGGVAGNVSVYTGYDLMPYMTGKKTTAENATDWLHLKHQVSPDFRIGGGLSGRLQGTLQNSLNFKLTEDELPGFIHGLTHGTLTPTELMQKGIEHQMKQGSKLVFSVDTSAAFDLRAGINITDEGVKPNTVTARVSTGVSGSLNLVAGRRDRSTKAGEFGSTISASDNRPTFFNSASVGANLTAVMGVAHSSTHDGKAVGIFPAFTSTNVSVALAMDNRTTQNISVELKQADPVTNNDITELTSTLGKHFKDSDSVKLLADLKKEENPDPVKQLDALHRHFNTSSVVGDDRYEAVRTLQKLALRQQAVDSNTMELASARHSTSYGNLSRLDKNGIFSILQHHFNAALPASSATRLSAMMDSDPVLKGLIKALQKTPYSSASVTMELKDDLRDQTEKAILDGKVGRDELGVLFQDRNNLRIRSVSVSQFVSKNEGFNTPTLILGASNSAGVSMGRNIGTINFKYGQDQDIPRRFTLEGEIAKANPQVASALSELKKEGFEMKS
uniref:AvrE n=2 Tax=Erwinia psidii TaxID=69224 RepID=A0A8E6HRQ8_9GAMM|nr:AvrE [Erwinia psidii]